MKTGKKGEFQYIRQEKKKRIVKTLLFFLIPAVIITTGVLIYKTTLNLITVLGVLLCLPACKALVGVIMICMYHSIPKDEFESIEEHRGSLTMAYENVLTNYEKNTFVDAFAVCGNQVIGYSGSPKTDLKYAEEHTQKILHHNGYKVNVKIFKDLNPFLERMDTMNLHEESLRADIPFTPDEHYPDLSREELIRHTILTISL